jgi:hypothetical protein
MTEVDESEEESSAFNRAPQIQMCTIRMCTSSPEVSILLVGFHQFTLHYLVHLPETRV